MCIGRRRDIPTVDLELPATGDTKSGAGHVRNQSNCGLAVKPQEVVPGQAESANGRFLGEASMWPVPIVAVQPGSERLAPLLGVLEGGGVGPFSERGLDEAFGISVGLGRIGLDPDVLDAKLLAGAGEGFREIAAAIVGHDAFDGDAEALEVSDRGEEEGDGAFLPLIREDVGTAIREWSAIAT